MVRKGRRVTLSLGVCSFRKSGKTTPDKMFKLADKSLYIAKNRGRNRCGPVQTIKLQD
jgi:PleD family two-component response regulator